MHRSKLLTSATAVLFAVAFAAYCKRAQAQPKGDACADAYESAQEFRKASKLKSTEEMLSACAQKSCGKFLYHECSVWLKELRHDMPSVILSVSDDATGASVDDVQVSIDGAPLTSALNGKAIAVDPGLHEFRFNAKGHATVSQQVNIRKGHQERRLAIRLPARSERSTSKDAPDRDTSDRDTSDQAAAEPRPRGSSKSSAPYVIGSVGLLGMVGFGVFGALAKSEHAEVRECLPTCPRAQLARVSTFYTTANISLGVGIVGLGTAAVLFLTSGGSAKKPKETRESKPSDKTRIAGIDVRRTDGGMFAELRGSF